MPLFYANASALIKLVRDEPEREALRTFFADADLVSCELGLTELHVRSDARPPTTRAYRSRP